MRWTSVGVLAVIVAGLAAALIFANAALLGIGEEEDEPVGRLSPRSVVVELGIDTGPASTVPETSTENGETEPPSTGTTTDEDSGGGDDDERDEDD